MFFLLSDMDMKTTRMNMMDLMICPTPELKLSISMIWLSRVMDTAPTRAEWIRLLAPPETGMPPKTMAMITSIPTLEAVFLERVGA